MGKGGGKEELRVEGCELRAESGKRGPAPRKLGEDAGDV
jgi:hypothetical protein